MLCQPGANNLNFVKDATNKKDMGELSRSLAKSLERLEDVRTGLPSAKTPELDSLLKDLSVYEHLLTLPLGKLILDPGSELSGILGRSSEVFAETPGVKANFKSFWKRKDVDKIRDGILKMQRRVSHELEMFTVSMIGFHL